MLLNWFAQSIPSSLSTTLNENDLNALTMQYCTNLLIAGIIKPLDTPSRNSNEVFKVSRASSRETNELTCVAFLSLSFSQI
jgi:hypothetical protein